MLKALAQFIGLAVAFFGTWYLLSRVDFMGIFHVEEFSRENEHKLAGLVLDVVRKESGEVESDSVRSFLGAIKRRICVANGIDDSTVVLHVIIKEDVNAFALPDGHLVLTTGLVRYCNTAEELSGVLAHEIAHIEHRDVMKKLVREVGLAMLTTIVGGDAGAEVGRETVRMLSSSAFDREQEREADVSAVHMMAKAEIDPEHFANLLFRLSHEKGKIPKLFEWVSTHPNTQERSAEILRLRKLETYQSKPITTPEAWRSFVTNVD